MKLIIATPLYPPEIGGPATYAKLLVEGLPKKGIEVSLEKFNDVRHLPKIIRHYMYYRRVLKAARNADVVLALDPVSVGLPAMWAARRAGKPFVVKIVGDYAWEQGRQRFGITQNLDEFVKTARVPFPVRVLRRIQTRVAAAATRVIVPSEYLQDIVSAWGIPRAEIQVINNAINIPARLPTFGKEPGTFLIVSAGRDVPWKHFDALKRVGENNPKHPNWRVHIASNVPREEALGWMKAADVFVLNSSYEGFPHALIEAMTLGIPVVATDAKFHRNLLGDGQAGLLVPIGDDHALEKALETLAQDPDTARVRADVAQEGMKRFELSSMLDATAQLLKSL